MDSKQPSNHSRLDSRRLMMMTAAKLVYEWQRTATHARLIKKERLGIKKRWGPTASVTQQHQLMYLRTIKIRKRSHHTSKRREIPRSVAVNNVMFLQNSRIVSQASHITHHGKSSTTPTNN